MLLKHSFQYFFARGIPGIISFLAIALYTRLLTPEEYGHYALTIAVVSLAYTVLFHWLPLSLLRFAPAQKGNRTELLSTLFATYLSLVLISGVLGTALWVFVDNPIWRMLSPLGILILWARAWFELNKEMARSDLSPKRYGVMEFAKALIGIIIGSGLAFFGFGEKGVLIGFGIGLFLSTFWNTPHLRSVLRYERINYASLAPMLRYGLPLSATFAFEFIVSGSDRILLGWLLDAKQAGLYAAGYDLPRQVLILLMVIINLAAYPLAVRAYETKGKAAVQKQLSKNLALLLMVALPSVAGMIVLAPNISHVLLGSEFQQVATQIIPWIAIATLFDGLRAFYIDLSFQLSKQTTRQITIISFAAMVNIIGNFFLIPKFGLMGAAYATVIAYATALILAYILSIRFFESHFKDFEPIKIVMAVAGMVLTLLPLIKFRGALPLVIQVSVGIASYILFVVWLNIGGSRYRVRNIVGRLQV